MHWRVSLSCKPQISLGERAKYVCNPYILFQIVYRANTLHKLTGTMLILLHTLRREVRAYVKLASGEFPQANLIILNKDGSYLSKAKLEQGFN